jgi:alkylation response protein AidB-like acyl-CoA dehydrogenase
MSPSAWRKGDDERMVRDAVESIVTRAQPIAAGRRARAAGVPSGHTPGLWLALVEAGFAMPHLAESVGGAGLGYATTGIVAETLGRHLGQVPLIATAMALEVAVTASVAQRASTLEAFTARTATTAVALDETDWHDPEAIETNLTRASDGTYRIDGVKSAVIGGATADMFLVVARSLGRTAIVLLPRNAPGLRITPLRWIDGSDVAQVVLAGTVCGPEMLLAEGDAAAAAIDRACDVGRSLLAAELLGAATEAFDRTLAYLRHREQFGRKIGTFQALQHRAARLFVNLEMTRAAIRRALVSLDHDDPEASNLTCLAKWISTRTARDVMNEAVQMHGGIGVTDELDIGLFFKRAQALGEQLGDDDFHRDRLARRRWRLG